VAGRQTPERDSQLLLVISEELEHIKALLISVEFTIWNNFPLISI
jgi:hypothetical protein